MYIIISIIAVIFILIYGFALDFLEQFMPRRVFDAILIVTFMLGLRWVLLDLIKDANADIKNELERIRLAIKKQDYED